MSDGAGMIPGSDGVAIWVSRLLIIKAKKGERGFGALASRLRYAILHRYHGRRLACRQGAHISQDQFAGAVAAELPFRLRGL